MSTIDEKLLKIQTEVASMKFKKSGFNKFAHFPYYTLDDLLPAVRSACIKNNVLMKFKFPKDEAILVLKDLDCEEPSESKSLDSVPMPPLKELPQQNIAQSEGSYMTYMKKYLIQNTFLISEECEDIDIYPPGEITNVTPDDVNKYTNADKCLQSIKSSLQKEGKDITKENLINCVQRLSREKIITQDMFKQVMRLIQEEVL